LKQIPKQRFPLVLTNPPFGTFSEREACSGSSRPDFWVSTSNKQLAFLQHIYSLLAEQGRAAVVIPDNVLFEGGAGEIVRRNLLATCNVHTLLRLPTGIFYAPGVKANVLFFDRGAQTERLWVYDLRTNVHCSLRTHPLTHSHFEDFLASYCAEDRAARKEKERFRSFCYEELSRRDRLNLDLSWLPDATLVQSADLRDPLEITSEIITDLEYAIASFKEFTKGLPGSKF
jgi:type I restriction enzyme M protein